jgi:hypothetical protein
MATEMKEQTQGRQVHVLDGWNEQTGKAILRVYADKIEAEAALAKLLKREEGVYAGVVTCKVR